MRQMNVAIGILACLLAACAEPTATPLTPTGSRNVTIQLKPTPTPTLTISSPDNCVTRVDWEGAGVATIDHEVEIDVDGRALATTVSADKHLDLGSSTVQWNPGSFYQSGVRVPTGRAQAIAHDHKNRVLASTGWVDVGFDCIGG